MGYACFIINLNYEFLRTLGRDIREFHKEKTLTIKFTILTTTQHLACASKIGNLYKRQWRN